MALVKNELLEEVVLQLTQMRPPLEQAVIKTVRKRGLVHCLNPDDHLGRLYELTKSGEKVRKKLG